MKDSNSLINESVQEIAASKKTSTTEAGRSSTTLRHNTELQDAINQVFALFRINFHNQYHAAFSDTQLLNQAKKLWLETLGYFSAEQILRGARQVIEQSEYLPTLHRMIEHCEEAGAATGLPSLREAYLEACTAPSPKAAHSWSHPVVYHAGKATGWRLLSHETEAMSFPRFRDHYRRLCQQMAQGVEMPAPEKALPEKPAAPLSKAENIKQLQKLRKILDL